MSDKQDGGPAFPQANTAYGEHFIGVSIRDYFAAKAMARLLDLWHRDMTRMEGADYEGLNIIDNERGTPLMIAEEAYAMADAMLTARDQS